TAQVQDDRAHWALRRVVELLLDRRRRGRRERRDLQNQDVFFRRGGNRSRLEASPRDGDRQLLLITAAKDAELERGALGTLQSRLDLPVGSVSERLAVDRIDQ